MYMWSERVEALSTSPACFLSTSTFRFYMSALWICGGMSWLELGVPVRSVLAQADMIFDIGMTSIIDGCHMDSRNTSDWGDWDGTSEDLCASLDGFLHR
jgi:hypothetical protein